MPTTGPKANDDFDETGFTGRTDFIVARIQ
jgi:hypothetical protein